MWNTMRMSQSDLADVTGYTYTYLLNGRSPNANWTGLFKPGERVKLRFVNASAMTFFDIRIPGLDMTVVAMDGQPVKPVRFHECRLGVAETIDVIVTPRKSKRSPCSRKASTAPASRAAPSPRPGHERGRAGDGPAAAVGAHRNGYGRHGRHEPWRHGRHEPRCDGSRQDGPWRHEGHAARRHGSRWYETCRDAA
ncbi:hypothetical protein HML84_15640 [Alcanivorax sp. IO_7]|nr:hypothetical protein HML84_15640 [Alcanivorax sp. IO_7]